MRVIILFGETFLYSAPTTGVQEGEQEEEEEEDYELYIGGRLVTFFLCDVIFRRST